VASGPGTGHRGCQAAHAGSIDRIRREYARRTVDIDIEALRSRRVALLVDGVDPRQAPVGSGREVDEGR